MSINDIILNVMIIFMVIGAIDKAFLNNKFGYGEQFEEGIMAMGALAMAMVGIMCLAPVIGTVLTPVVTPIFKLMGADPAMFAGSLLAIDMGGFAISQTMTTNQEVVMLSGIILGSMMGATIVFSIPVSLGIIEKEDHPYLAKGILAGIIAIPVGCFVGGLIAGISVGTLTVNLIPVILLSVLLALGLWKIPDKVLAGFNIFAKFITILILIGFALGIIQGLSGWKIIPGMDDIEPQLETVGLIAITLAGAYPLVHFITTVFKKPLMKLGKLIGVNEVAAAGIVATLANNIPMFGMMKDMDERGKVIAVAFSVGAAFALGDHLGYTSANAPELIFPMIAGKIVAGIFGIIVAQVLVLRKTPSAK